MERCKKCGRIGNKKSSFIGTRLIYIEVFDTVVVVTADKIKESLREVYSIHAECHYTNLYVNRYKQIKLYGKV